MADETTEQSTDPIKLATELTVAWLSNPNSQASAEDVPAFLEKMLTKINALTGQGAPIEAAPEHKPAVPVRSSVKPDYLVSLIDGRKLKSLKRHLSSHGLTPKEYRERYGLKADYPMVAPSYSAIRRAVAEKLGLGRKVVSKATTPAKAPAAKASAPAAKAAAPAKPATTSAPAAKTSAVKPAKAAAPAKKAPAASPAATKAPAKAATAPKPAVKAKSEAKAAPKPAAAPAARGNKKPTAKAAPSAKAAPATKADPVKS